jgi:hypothetical protein
MKSISNISNNTDAKRMKTLSKIKMWTTTPRLAIWKRANKAPRKSMANLERKRTGPSSKTVCLMTQ